MAIKQVKQQRPCVKQSKIDIDILHISILNKEEYLKYKDAIPSIIGDDNSWEYSWWLKTSDDSPYGVYCVYDNNINAKNVEISSGIRPILIIRKNPNILVGDKIEIAGKSWTVISNKYLLCDSFLDKLPFYKDCKSKYAKNWNKSEVKKYIVDWYKNNICLAK